MLNLPAQPLNSLKVLGLGLKIWKATLNQSMPFALLAATVTMVFNLIMMVLGIDNSQTGQASQQIQLQSWQLGVLLFSLVAYLFLSLFATCGMIIQIYRAAYGTPLDFNSTTKVSIKKMVPFFIVNILYVLSVLLGSLLLIIPGILLTIYFVCASYLVVITDKGIINSFKDSYALVKGSWWHASTVLFLIWLCAFILILVVGLGGGLCLSGIKHLFQMTENSHFLQYGLLAIEGVAVIFGCTLIFSSMIALIHNLQKRKELIPVHSMKA